MLKFWGEIQKNIKVYVKFYNEEDADACAKGLENRWFNGEPIYAELSPVTDFREACCRQVY